MWKDYYQVLGISPDATEEDIEKACEQLVLIYHPDRNSSPEAKENLKKLMMLFFFLSKPSRRDHYDRAYYSQLIKIHLRKYKISERALDEMDLYSAFLHRKFACQSSSGWNFSSHIDYCLGESNIETIKIFCKLVQGIVEFYSYELEKLKLETISQIENLLVNNQGNLSDWQKKISWKCEMIWRK